MSKMDDVARQIRHKYWNVGSLTTFPVDPYKIGESLGFDIATSSHFAPKDVVYGFGIKDKTDKRIFLNSMFSDAVKRFHLATILGDYFLTGSESQKVKDWGFVHNREQSQRVSHKQARELGIALLVPESSLLRKYAEGEDILSFGTYYGVQFSVVTEKMRSIGLDPFRLT